MDMLKDYELVKLEDLTPGSEVGFENPREKLTEIKELAADIEARGLMNPLQVWKTQKDGEDIMVLVGGFRREAAITLLIEEGRANGFSSGVPVHFVTGETLRDARYNALADNIQHNALTSYEIAMECSRLKAMGDNQKTIAKGLNKSETWVSRKLKALENAGTALKKAWKAGKLADDTVETLAELVTWSEPDGDKPSKPSFDAQEEAVEEAVKAVDSGGRGGKSKARKGAKNKAGKSDRPGTKILKAMVQIVDETDEEVVERTPYVQGVFDTLRFAQGSIGLGKMGSDWKEFVKASETFAKEKAKEDAAEAAAKAKEWAEGKGKKGKKGKKAAE